MTKDFTLNQLTRLLYKETTPAESSMLIELVDLCPPLNEKFENLKAGKALLDNISYSPSQKSVENILAYSRVAMA